MAGARSASSCTSCWRSLLFAFWPFTRLVHVFSAPIGYLTRPYIVYRSRDRRRRAAPPRLGWSEAPRARSCLPSANRQGTG